jgi:hypothetical protein
MRNDSGLRDTALLGGQMALSRRVEDNGNMDFAMSNGSSHHVPIFDGDNRNFT